MEQVDADVCLVSMPFLPITTPALGPSLLKAALARERIQCDIFYGSLELIRLFASTERDTAVSDYSYLATCEDVGEVFFAPAMWPAAVEQVRNILVEMATLPKTPFPREDMVLLVDRILKHSTTLGEFFRRCVAAYDWSKYRIIGFSTTFSQNNASLAFARMLKERQPETTIVFGGANCDGEMGEQLLRSFSWIDHVFQGEADASFPQFARHLVCGDPAGGIPGLLSRADGVDGAACFRPPTILSSLDKLPVPDFSDYFADLPEAIEKSSVSIPIELSRGCWWGATEHCIFCGLNAHGMVFRSKAPTRAFDEISSLTKQWDIRSVALVDNILDMNYFETVLPNLESLNLQIFCETKSNLSEVQVEALARAGVRTIQPGIESLNTATLRHMHKGARAKNQLELLKWCTEHHVNPLWFYLYGFPGENEEWYTTDIELLSSLHHFPPPMNPNPVVIDRFSPMFDDPASYGLSNFRPAWRNEVCYFGLDFESRARLAYHFDADFPDGGMRSYEADLWRAVELWRTRYKAGAKLVQTVARNCTLVVDTRTPGGAKVRLLCGLVHEVHKALWSAHTVAQLENLESLRDYAPVPSPLLEPIDLEIAIGAAGIGAEILELPDSTNDIAAAIEVLMRHDLVVHVDKRWLALSTNSGRG